MARPTKKGLDYFPFDVDFFEDDKIALIEAEFGTKGVLVAIRLLCKIYKNGYYYRWGDDECLLLCKQLGAAFVPNTVKEIVAGLVKRSFFDERVLNSFGVLTSRGIQQRYVEAIKKRPSAKTDCLIEEKYSLFEFIPNKPEFIPNKPEFIPNKCDKLKERKENNISLSFSPSFDEVEKNDETGGKSAEPTATERENFFRIFFFKNFLSPETEVSRFIDHYEATGWTRNGGAKVKDRAALARSWASKDEKKRFPPNFLAFWQELYNAFEKSGATTQSLHELLCDLRGFSEDGRALLLTLTPNLHEFIENSTPIVKPILQKHYPKCLLNYSLMP